MGCVKNVIQTADVFAAALEHCNRDSALELMQQVMQLTEAANHETNITLSTQINAVRNDLARAVASLAPVVGALDLAEVVLSGPADTLDGPFTDAAGPWTRRGQPD